jgi:hypothetical protein
VDPLFILTLSFSLSALLAGSAVHQLTAWGEWQGVVQNYRLLPLGWVAAAAALLPATEILIAVALLLPPGRWLGACVAAALFCLYAAAMGINISRGRTAIDCGCFGSRLRHGISAWMVVRNLLLASFALLLCLPASPRSVSAADVLFSVILVVTLGFLYPVLGVVLQRAPPRYEENYRRTASQTGK